MTTIDALTFLSAPVPSHSGNGGTPAPVWLTIIVVVVFSAIAGLTWFLKRRNRGG